MPSPSRMPQNSYINTPPDIFAARSYVQTGANLIEIKRKKLTGNVFRQTKFFKVEPTGQLVTKNKTGMLVDASEGAGIDLPASHKLTAHETRLVFRIQVSPMGPSVKEWGQSPTEVTCLAPTENERRLWVAGIRAVLAGKGAERVGTTPEYTGELKRGIPHGRGVGVWPDGGRYVGEWEDGMLQGMGVYEWPNHDVYQGEWQRGVRHGRGMLACADGSVYQGMWAADRKQGMGVEANALGERFVGSWKDGEREGVGVATQANGIKRCSDNRAGREVFQGTYPPGDRLTAARYARAIADGNTVAQSAAHAAHKAKEVARELDQGSIRAASPPRLYGGSPPPMSPVTATQMASTYQSPTVIPPSVESIRRHPGTGGTSVISRSQYMQSPSGLQETRNQVIATTRMV